MDFIIADQPISPVNKELSYRLGCPTKNTPKTLAGSITIQPYTDLTCCIRVNYKIDFSLSTFTLQATFERRGQLLKCQWQQQRIQLTRWALNLNAMNNKRLTHLPVVVKVHPIGGLVQVVFTTLWPHSQEAPRSGSCEEMSEESTFSGPFNLTAPSPMSLHRHLEESLYAFCRDCQLVFGEAYEFVHNVRCESHRTEDKKAALVSYSPCEVYGDLAKKMHSVTGESWFYRPTHDVAAQHTTRSYFKKIFLKKMNVVSNVQINRIALLYHCPSPHQRTCDGFDSAYSYEPIPLAQQAEIILKFPNHYRMNDSNLKPIVSGVSIECCETSEIDDKYSRQYVKTPLFNELCIVEEVEPTELKNQCQLMREVFGYHHEFIADFIYFQDFPHFRITRTGDHLALDHFLAVNRACISVQTKLTVMRALTALIYDLHALNWGLHIDLESVMIGKGVTPRLRTISNIFPMKFQVPHSFRDRQYTGKDVIHQRCDIEALGQLLILVGFGKIPFSQRTENWQSMWVGHPEGYERFGGICLGSITALLLKCHQSEVEIRPFVEWIRIALHYQWEAVCALQNRKSK